MNNASIAIQVLPFCEKSDMIGIIDKVIEHIKQTGLNYMVGPFETTVEGDLEALLDIIKAAQVICEKEGADSVLSYVKINYKPGGGVMSIEEKTSKHAQ